MKRDGLNFVQIRANPSWEVGEHFIIYVIKYYHGIHLCMMYLYKKTKKAQIIVQKNATPHKLSRGGYDLL